MRYFLAVMALLALPSGAADGRTTDPVHGYWLTQNHKAIVEMAPCGTATCGRMVWVDSGRSSADRDQAGHAGYARPLCGIELIGGLKRAGVGDWQDGWVYNPKNGETYGAEVHALSPYLLKVRGYLGTTLLGKSQVWTRVSGDRGGCRQS